MGQEYWDDRARQQFSYQDESLYTITPGPFYVARRELVMRQLERLVSDDSVRAVLDYGCGDGWYLSRLRRCRPTASYWGVDSSGEMLQLAAAKYPGLLLGLSLSDVGERTFDLIYVVAVLAHVQDDELPGLLTELSRRLNEGGHLCIFEQTGPVHKEWSTGVRRRPTEYHDAGRAAGLTLEYSTLVAFRPHRWFERHLVPYLHYAYGRGNGARGTAAANRSGLFRGMSALFVWLSRNKEFPDNGRFEGNSLVIFGKPSPSSKPVEWTSLGDLE